MRIGSITFENNLALAPMAGITDRPFRELCRRLGAGIAPSEMITSDVKLWHTEKSKHRLDHSGEPGPRIVQIAGGDPESMALAARMNVERGADIIDINMGCPAKKVCNKAAGSALLKDEDLVKRILESVVKAVDVPVTLKTRIGWDDRNLNGIAVARMAEEAGIQALAVHGRTRADMYKGHARYAPIREIKSAISIPVFANGDVDSPQKARDVLEMTGADGLMVGRAAQGRPWIFREIAAFMENGTLLPAPSRAEVAGILLEHLENLYRFYGDGRGVRIARKHVGWYAAHHPGADALKRGAMRAESTHGQIALVRAYFDGDPAEVAA